MNTDYKGRVMRLKHDVRIDFEASRKPVKGLTVDLGDGPMQIGPTHYEPEPRVIPKGTEYWVDGWWLGKTHPSWDVSAAQGNPACMQYEFRRAAAGLPNDDQVLYGHTRGFDTYGYLFHISELEG